VKCARCQAVNQVGVRFGEEWMKIEVEAVVGLRNR
jgi:phage FluMu protein Com